MLVVLGTSTALWGLQMEALWQEGGHTTWRALAEKGRVGGWIRVRVTQVESTFFCWALLELCGSSFWRRSFARQEISVILSQCTGLGV